MGIPLLQKLFVGSYVVRQRLTGRKRYPLVLMLEPLFRCNLACAGCGKIDYPDHILNQRMSVEDALHAVDECGAPVVSIAGGEPLLHKELPEIVRGIVARKKFVYLCTNALLMEKKMTQYEPSTFFTWSVHLDGDKEMHDISVCQAGRLRPRGCRDQGSERARLPRQHQLHAVQHGASRSASRNFFDTVTELGVDGITVSPGYAYERAPDQQHFLNRGKTKQLFRDIFKRGPKDKKWSFSQSSMFLDFLAGNQSYHCTPWGNPTRTIFGWQKPCYLLGEGYAKTFKELMDGTDWDAYGTGNYEKCADCMVHSGYEASAVNDAVAHPLKALAVSLRGPRTEGEMAPEISLDRQRPAEYVFSKHVERKMEEIREAKSRPELAKAADNWRDNKRRDNRAFNPSRMELSGGFACYVRRTVYSSPFR